jgi:hypothetical protein
MKEIRKYPRTQHLRGSQIQIGDHDMESIPWNLLSRRLLTIEEKVDGGNVGISFEDNGTLLLQSRGHYLRGGPREKQFDWLKQWTATHQEKFFDVLGFRYVMYGENLYAKHTVFYDALPHYFMEFDILDIQNDVFLSTEARQQLLAPIANMITPVRVLKHQRFEKLNEVESLLGPSAFVTEKRQQNYLDAALQAGVLPKNAAFGNAEIQAVLAQSDWSPLMEGLYIKWEENGIVKGRYKYVRKSFTNKIIEQETHWVDRPIIANGLIPGVFETMFT